MESPAPRLGRPASSVWKAIPDHSYLGKTMAKLDGQRRAAAYHEAGHAVADMEHGFPFTEVRIQPKDGGYEGAVVGIHLPKKLKDLEHGRSQKSVTELKKHIICCYAGEGAQSLAGEPMDPVVEAANDIDCAERYLKWIAQINRYDEDVVKDEIGELRRELRREARELINKQRREIEAVGDELDRIAAERSDGCGKLSYREVWILVQESS